MRVLTSSNDAETPDMAVDVPRYLALLESLQGRLTALGVRAELREHLLSLVVFRVPPGLPVCVFVSGSRFYCWDNGIRREHVARIDHVAAELAELANSRIDRTNGTGPVPSRKGPSHPDSGEERPVTTVITRPPARPPETPPRPPGRRTDTFELGALPDAVPSARWHVRLILDEWELSGLVPDAEQIAAELITNAIKATRNASLDAPVRLTLVADDASVLVVVWDAVPLPPVRVNPGPDGESGRGLLMVAALSAWWDCVPVPAARGGGKLVRAMVTGSPGA